MNESYDKYKQSVKVAVQNLKGSIAFFLTKRDEESIDAVREKLRVIGLMFGDIDRAPSKVQLIAQAFDKFVEFPNHAGHCHRLLENFGDLEPADFFDAGGSDDGVPSFDAIFDAYKSAKDLDLLVDEFTSFIQRFLDEQDEHLTRQIARELELILSKLKNREKKSLFEVQTWIDLGVKALLLYAETQSGGHGYALAWEGVKAGAKTVRQIIAYHETAQGKLMEANGMKFAPKAAIKYPQIPSIDELDRLPIPMLKDDRPPHEGGE